MTSELYGLADQAHNEPFEDTIRKLLYDNYSIADSVPADFVSEGGVNNGGMTVTGQERAKVILHSAADPNTHLTLFWQVRGTAGNDWSVFLQHRNAPTYEVQAGSSRLRIRMPSTGTMADFKAGLESNTDITDLITFGDIIGNPAAQRPADGTTAFTGGTDHVVNRDQELSTDDYKVFEAESNVFVRVYDGDILELSTGPGFTYCQQTVFVDIFGKHGHADNVPNIIRVRDEIDSIILAHQTGPYPKSRDGANSAIIGLNNYGISWARRSEGEEAGIRDSLHGEVFCLFQRNLSA